MPDLSLTKLEVVRRQIETAIRLWFHSADPVSVHTLTAASHQIIHDLGKKKGQPTILREPTNIKPEYEKAVHELVRRYETFFKHADRDGQALLKFDPKATEIYMLDTILSYEIQTKESVPLLHTFKAWMFLNNPELASGEFKASLLMQIKGLDLKAISKLDFLYLYLPIAIKSGIA